MLQSTRFDMLAMCGSGLISEVASFRSHLRLTFDCSSLEGESNAALSAEKCMSVSTPQSRHASAMARAPVTCTSENLKFLYM